MENNLTAVEWLKIALEHDSGMELKDWIKDLFKEAIEMEKQQIKDAFYEGSESWHETSEEYYTKTYNKQQS